MRYQTRYQANVRRCSRAEGSRHVKACYQIYIIALPHTKMAILPAKPTFVLQASAVATSKLNNYS